MLVRAARPGDSGAVAAIEQSSPSAWSAAQIASEFEHSGRIGLIACSETDDRSVGWCCARFCPPEAELLKITVLPQYRGSGAGSRLLAALLNHMDRQGCSVIFLEVRSNNLPARKFYRNNGFIQIARRNNYYQNPADDGLIFKRYI